MNNYKSLSPYKTIGILGGMGPSASLGLYQKIIKIAQKKYKSEQDIDYPPMIIYNLPLVGFDETGVVKSDIVKEQLIAGVKKLEMAGSDFIIIACNTVHSFYNGMQLAINIPIINMINAVVRQVKNKGYSAVGLLTSESTNKLQLYNNALRDKGIKSLSVSAKGQKKINKVILRVMSGNQNKQDVRVLGAIIERLKDKGAKGVVFGCTEIPLAITQKNVDIEVFDAVEIIASLALEKARKSKN